MQGIEWGAGDTVVHMVLTSIKVCILGQYIDIKLMIS